MGREGESMEGKERKGRGVPRSLGDVLDDKKGMREDKSRRRRRDVQNMRNEDVFRWGLVYLVWSYVDYLCRMDWNSLVREMEHFNVKLKLNWIGREMGSFFV